MLDLCLSQEQRWKGYHPKTRNILRKCGRNLDFHSSDDTAMFEKLYLQTLARNAADEFYFFDRDYFNTLLALEGVRLYEVTCESRVVAMAFMMLGTELGHYHLSANSTEDLNLNANYYLLDSAFEEMRKLGATRFLLGGGRTSDPQDSLLRFKRKFSGECGRFHIAGIVHDMEKYQEYIARWESLNPTSTVRYFLKYRLKGT